MGRGSSKVAWLGLLLIVGCRDGDTMSDGAVGRDGDAWVTSGDGARADLAPRARCDDGERDGDESDRDCGGSCAPCDDGEGCLLGRDCASGYCQQGQCVPDDGCGWACGEDESCVGGACLCGGEHGEACAPGWGCCSGACVDLMSDLQNCGACGHVCEYSGSECTGGGCAFVDWFGCMSCPDDPLCPFLGACPPDGGVPACSACPSDALCPYVGACTKPPDAGVPRDAGMGPGARIESDAGMVPDAGAP